MLEEDGSDYEHEVTEDEIDRNEEGQDENDPHPSLQDESNHQVECVT